MTTTRESEIRAVIERYAVAWRDADLPNVLDCYHDDIVLHWFGANALSGDHAGKGAAVAALGEFTRRTRRNVGQRFRQSGRRSFDRPGRFAADHQQKAQHNRCTLKDHLIPPG